MSHATGGPSPDAKHAAISGRQVALIGAIAGVLSALISIPTAIISADRASESALNTTLAQLSGETEKSQAEFLRSQRQVLYVQVIEHELALARAEEELRAQAVNSGFRPSPHNSKKYFNELYSVGRANQSFEESDGASVTIIASDTVRVAFDAIVVRHKGLIKLATNIYDASYRQAQSKGRDRRHQKASSATYVKYEESLKLLAAERKAFLTACRVDMGNR